MTTLRRSNPPDNDIPKYGGRGLQPLPCFTHILIPAIPTFRRAMTMTEGKKLTMMKFFEGDRDTPRREASLHCNIVHRWHWGVAALTM